MEIKGFFWKVTTRVKQINAVDQNIWTGARINSDKYCSKSGSGVVYTRVFTNVFTLQTIRTTTERYRKHCMTYLVGNSLK